MIPLPSTARWSEDPPPIVSHSTERFFVSRHVQLPSLSCLLRPTSAIALSSSSSCSSFCLPVDTARKRAIRVLVNWRMGTYPRTVRYGIVFKSMLFLAIKLPTSSSSRSPICMCSECAKVLRFQTNRCPICRQPVERLLEIKINNRAEQRQEAAPLLISPVD
ncbi:hypothetical protein BHM03_00049278 [Ensete ventricosum]|nr:hypothetical protein BHM03_00049278 [Ensete ventricosum]